MKQHFRRSGSRAIHLGAQGNTRPGGESNRGAHRLGFKWTSPVRMKKLGISPDRVSERDGVASDASDTSGTHPRRRQPASQIPQNRDLAEKRCPLLVWQGPCLIQGVKQARRLMGSANTKFVL